MEESNETTGEDAQAELCLRVLANGRRYFGSWSNWRDMTGDFLETSPSEMPQDHQIIFASYGTGSYEGDCLVIFLGANNRLYEVNASHCSCNGLEDSWKPEVTSWEAIAMRGSNGRRILGDDHEPDAVEALDLLLRAHDEA